MASPPTSGRSWQGQKASQAHSTNWYRREGILQKPKLPHAAIRPGQQHGQAISDGNDTQSGKVCFSELSEEQRDSVEAVVMEMSAAYVKVAGEVIPEAQIVHDRIMQLATTAVDKVRRGEHRELKQNNDDRLAKTKYVWLKSQENLSEKKLAKLEEVFTCSSRRARRGLTRNCYASSGTMKTPARRLHTSRIGTSV